MNTEIRIFMFKAGLVVRVIPDQSGSELFYPGKDRAFSSTKEMLRFIKCAIADVRLGKFGAGSTEPK